MSARTCLELRLEQRVKLGVGLARLCNAGKVVGELGGSGSLGVLVGLRRQTMHKPWSTFVYRLMA